MDASSMIESNFVHQMVVLALAPDTLLVIYKLFPILFVVAYGACVGSLLNVVVYRVPLGISLVFPPSACPSCQTRLTWRENIPVLGWLLLGGRCRFCKSKISPEYPIVEALVAILFGGMATLYYVVPNNAVWLGIDWGAIKPEWAVSGAMQTWPAFTTLLILLSCLVAMTIIDAKTTHIPLAIPWFATLVALVVLPANAVYVQYFGGTFTSLTATTGELWSAVHVPPNHRWVAPEPSWWWLGASLGGTVGIGVSLLLVRLGLIRQSFMDYEQWEAEEVARMEAAKAGQGGKSDSVGPAGAGGGDDPGMLWTAYPHARREMVREMAFLGPIAVLGWAGGAIATWAIAGQLRANPNQFGAPLEPHMPLWLVAIGAVLMGYLIGAGVVWVVRIGGSLGFNKEALGLGDVHLMGAVGAVCGWVDATLAFFGAAFVGLAWFLVAMALGGKVRRAMPYGPYLAAATLLVLLFKPLLEIGLTRLMQSGPGSMPINIP